MSEASKQCYCRMKGCTGGQFPDCGCRYTTSDDGVHFCQSHRGVNPERDKLARELAVIVINQCSGGMGSPMLTKARELLSLFNVPGVDLEAHERDLERQAGCGDV